MLQTPPSTAFPDHFLWQTISHYTTQKLAVYLHCPPQSPASLPARFLCNQIHDYPALRHHIPCTQTYEAPVLPPDRAADRPFPWKSRHRPAEVYPDSFHDVAGSVSSSAPDHRHSAVCRHTSFETVPDANGYRW